LRSCRRDKHVWSSIPFWEHRRRYSSRAGWRMHTVHRITARKKWEHAENVAHIIHHRVRSLDSTCEKLGGREIRNCIVKSLTLANFPNQSGKVCSRLGPTL